jgi:DNA-binding response OmpR family regulator
MILSGSNILILEDEAIVSFALEDMLAEAGAETLLAENLAVAAELINLHRFDAAILDINVHGERSYPVAAELRRRGLPFIFATGYGDVLKGTSFEGVPTVTKPYTFADIAGALAAIGIV